MTASVIGNGLNQLSSQLLLCKYRVRTYVLLQMAAESTERKDAESSGTKDRERKRSRSRERERKRHRSRERNRSKSPER